MLAEGAALSAPIPVPAEKKGIEHLLQLHSEDCKGRSWRRLCVRKKNLDQVLYLQLRTPIFQCQVSAAGKDGTKSWGDSTSLDYVWRQ